MSIFVMCLFLWSERSHPLKCIVLQIVLINDDRHITSIFIL